VSGAAITDEQRQIVAVVRTLAGVRVAPPPPSTRRANSSGGGGGRLFCTDSDAGVMSEAVQVQGGDGHIRDYPPKRTLRDAKVTEIYEATNEIQLVIARKMNRAAAVTDRAPRPRSARGRPRLARLDDAGRR